MAQSRQWLLTIPKLSFDSLSPLPDTVSYLRGQLEIAPTTGYEHWQIYALFCRSVRLSTVRGVFGNHHAESVKSREHSLLYVWKEETSVDGTRFEHGVLPTRRNSSKDWESVWELAKTGELESIPKCILVPHYSTLKKIKVDYLKPVATVRTIHVFWGPTATGKSRRAWDEAGLHAYPKDPRTKFWDGYQSQKNVVIDEFRGIIDIANLLRWFDRYPVIVEVKGSSACLVATEIWVTSNLHPKDWYPDLDPLTLEALLRRISVTQFHILK